jgi:4-hydroxy-tetrahydrodipicolinate synthase
MFKGLITALITPFKDDKIDVDSLKKLLEHQIKYDVNGIILAGTTGEGTTLTKDEYLFLMSTAVEISGKHIPIIAGYTPSSTKAAVDMAIEAEKVGVQGLMCTLPPYVKPMQNGLYAHFKAIHDSTSLPIMIYAAVSRCGVNISDETIVNLSKLGRILSIKDCGADIERPLRLSTMLNENFTSMTGDDSFSLAYNAQGAKGCVSVAANIMPGLCKELQNHWDNGNFTEALKIHQKLLPLYKALFVESNPIPVKYAASYLGLCSPEIRLPLLEASPDTKMQIENAILALNTN